MTTPAKPASAQPPRKQHLPAVGIIGLVLVAAAIGSIFYTQYLHPPSLVCQAIPQHRIYVMQAIIHEDGGFNVQATYKLNSTASLPAFSNVTGPQLPNGSTSALPALPDKSEIYGSVGDLVTLYIHPVDTNETSVQQPGLKGHGFAWDSTSFFSITNSTIPTNTLIDFGSWYMITLQLTQQGLTKYRCTQTCSAQHPDMNGNLSVGCGG